MINVANPVMAGAFKDPFTGSNIGDALFGALAGFCGVGEGFFSRSINGLR